MSTRNRLAVTVRAGTKEGVWGGRCPPLLHLASVKQWHLSQLLILCTYAGLPCVFFLPYHSNGTHPTIDAAITAANIRYDEDCIAMLLGPRLSGTLPVASPPKYQLPMSANFPSCVNMLALGPMVDLPLRKALA